jgi:ParB-like nuclease domain
MGSLTNFLANRKSPGLSLDQLNLFEGKPVPTGLALMVPVDQVDEDPDNPRKAFPPEAIEELAQDIAQRGMLQPIVVSDRNDKGLSSGSTTRRWCRAGRQSTHCVADPQSAGQHRRARPAGLGRTEGTTSMVRGLDLFSNWFAAYTDQYLLIGGTAASLTMEDAGLPYRATKDLDIVLHVQTAAAAALIATFGKDTAGSDPYRYNMGACIRFQRE